MSCSHVIAVQQPTIQLVSAQEPTIKVVSACPQPACVQAIAVQTVQAVAPSCITYVEQNPCAPSVIAYASQAIVNAPVAQTVQVGTAPTVVQIASAAPAVAVEVAAAPAAAAVAEVASAPAIAVECAPAAALPAVNATCYAPPAVACGVNTCRQVQLPTEERIIETSDADLQTVVRDNNHYTTFNKTVVTTVNRNHLHTQRVITNENNFNTYVTNNVTKVNDIHRQRVEHVPGETRVINSHQQTQTVEPARCIRAIDGTFLSCQ